MCWSGLASPRRYTQRELRARFLKKSKYKLDLTRLAFSEIVKFKYVASTPIVNRKLPPEILVRS